MSAADAGRDSAAAPLGASHSPDSSILLVGFDSAWTAHNRGGLVAVLRAANGRIEELGIPHSVTFEEAAPVIKEWQDRLKPAHTLILLDQPVIVENDTGQRAVERIVSSPISKHGGGMQPAYKGKAAMFGSDAPIWPFLGEFGGAADPLVGVADVAVYEAYPCLNLIALEWLLPCGGVCNRLPKYNPANSAKFSLHDWQHVCWHLSEELGTLGLVELPQWLDELKTLGQPHKADQDRLDACLCLITALHLADQRACLMVGDAATGYVVVPHGDTLHRELTDRCLKLGRDPAEWVREFRLSLRPADVST